MKTQKQRITVKPARRLFAEDFINAALVRLANAKIANDGQMSMPLWSAITRAECDLQAALERIAKQPNA
jgi:hypothetical protein